jgi:hypothetical protein
VDYISGGKRGYYAVTLQRSVILEALQCIKSAAGQHNVHFRLIDNIIKVKSSYSGIE